MKLIWEIINNICSLVQPVQYCKFIRIINIMFCWYFDRGGEVVRGYDFIVNSVWPEVVTNIEARVPTIFAPGNPNIFHKVSCAVLAI